jgi:hypothetical protein
MEDKNKLLNLAAKGATAMMLALGGIAGADAQINEADLLSQFKAFQTECAVSREMPKTVSADEKIDWQLKCFVDKVEQKTDKRVMSVAGNLSVDDKGQIGEYGVGNVFLGDELDEGTYETSLKSVKYGNTAYFQVQKGNERPELDQMPEAKKVPAKAAKRPVQKKSKIQNPNPRGMKNHRIQSR